MAYRTPYSGRCQSPKSHNRLDHLVLVPWLNNIAKSAIHQKRVCCQMGFGSVSSSGFSVDRCIESEHRSQCSPKGGRNGKSMVSTLLGFTHRPWSPNKDSIRTEQVRQTYWLAKPVSLTTQVDLTRTCPVLVTA